MTGRPNGHVGEVVKFTLLIVGGFIALLLLASAFHRDNTGDTAAAHDTLRAACAVAHDPEKSPAQFAECAK
jgi:hypothetical protein